MRGSSALGLAVIAILYATIGLMAVVGCVVVVRKVLRPPAEQVFYGMFLIAIAAFYLAFAAYFGIATAWRWETTAVAAFAVIGLIGARLPIVLMAGYLLHGGWDFLHELEAHGAYSAFGTGRLTEVPLAYPVFCFAFDVGMAVYCYGRRMEWASAWKARTVTGRAVARVT